MHTATSLILLSLETIVMALSGMLVGLLVIVSIPFLIGTPAIADAHTRWESSITERFQAVVAKFL